MNNTDIDQVKKQYLAQWMHVGCGGQPVAYVGAGLLGCSLCRMQWTVPLNEPLGETMLQVQDDFRSLILP